MLCGYVRKIQILKNTRGIEISRYNAQLKLKSVINQQIGQQVQMQHPQRITFTLPVEFSTK